MASDSHELAADLGRRIRAARTLSAKKVAELARDCGWSTEKQYKLEQARQVPDAIELATLAEVTGQPIEFFYTGITSASPQNDSDRRVITEPALAVKAGNA